MFRRYIKYNQTLQNTTKHYKTQPNTRKYVYTYTMLTKTEESTIPYIPNTIKYGKYKQPHNTHLDRGECRSPCLFEGCTTRYNPTQQKTTKHNEIQPSITKYKQLHKAHLNREGCRSPCLFEGCTTRYFGFLH